MALDGHHRAWAVPLLWGQKLCHWAQVIRVNPWYPIISWAALGATHTHQHKAGSSPWSLLGMNPKPKKTEMLGQRDSPVVKCLSSMWMTHVWIPVIRRIPPCPTRNYSWAEHQEVTSRGNQAYLCICYGCNDDSRLGSSICLWLGCLQTPKAMEPGHTQLKGQSYGQNSGPNAYGASRLYTDHSQAFWLWFYSIFADLRVPNLTLIKWEVSEYNQSLSLFYLF